MPGCSEPAAGRVNYDEVAPVYDQRYVAGGPQSIPEALLEVAREVGAERLLEVGCGTGHWMATLQSADLWICGVDLSAGMLGKAQTRDPALRLVRGHANRLPFRSTALDLVFCVNALHHFDEPRAFIHDAHRLLRGRGALAIIGMNPHAGRDRWYLYDYFPGTRDTDLRRYPSAGTVTDWMLAAGFDRVRSSVAARIVGSYTGRGVFDDPILQKNGTSQLTLLSDEAYAAGRARIDTAVARAEAMGEALVFPVDISLALVIGYAA